MAGKLGKTSIEKGNDKTLDLYFIYKKKNWCENSHDFSSYYYSRNLVWNHKWNLQHQTDESTSGDG